MKKSYFYYFLVLIFLFISSCKETPTSPDHENGSLYVNSTPSGAIVYLDGINSVKTTNCILTNISPGAHSLKLIKEGYLDYQDSVNITAGKTVTININLSEHKISIWYPTGETSWTPGENVKIRWETSDFALYQSKMNIVTLTEVAIDLYKGGSRVIAIVSKEFNDGSYLWKVPRWLSGGWGYRVRISCFGDSSIFGESQDFNIRDRGIYNSGQFTVHGTWQFDLDSCREIPVGCDFWWEQVNGIIRYIVPENGAKFYVVGIEDFYLIMYADLTKYPYSSNKINGSDSNNNMIPNNTVVAAITNEGRYCKFRIDSYGYNLTLTIVTY